MTTPAPITARKLPKGWLYQQDGRTVRKSGKGGDAYAFATTIDGQAVNFCGTIKSATSELAKLTRIRDSYRAHLGRTPTLEAYDADERASDAKTNGAWLAAQDAQRVADHADWLNRHVASGWKHMTEAAAWELAIVPITVVQDAGSKA
jgi:hypothetical protein